MKVKGIRPSARYTLAIVSVAAAALVRMICGRWVGDAFPFFSFYVAVAVTTWFAGLGPGMVALVLGYLATDLFFTRGFQTDPFGVLVYFSVTLTFVLFGQSMHQSRRRAEVSGAEARQHQRDLEQEISLRVQAEAALRQTSEKSTTLAGDLEKEVAGRTAKLMETIRSLEGFCYSIAHVLRAPIRAMQGYAGILGEDASLGTSARDYAHRITHAAAHMDQLVQDLLVYGRLIHEPVERGPVHLEAVVDHVLSELSTEISARNAVVKVARPLPQAMAHATVLEQLLANLLRNAMTFVSPGTLPRIVIRAKESGGIVRLSVEDNGIGIAECYHDRIFNVFERLHCTESYKGTGIGLAIVKKGVERMGGRVGVSSDPGKGSCFWMELAGVPGMHLPPAHPELKLSVNS
ncbi:MAG TPA: ATP-binding protein [Candidatus Saccharimonadales bacterium]|nr:ATP-binding protein [Candidatus Saccharimonadales bacterium]